MYRSSGVLPEVGLDGALVPVVGLEDAVHLLYEPRLALRACRVYPGDYRQVGESLLEETVGGGEIGGVRRPGRGVQAFI